ncbi:MAG: bifunctional diaminohydroxyphosphoribosylaminopyrimidine deaminase/5-amino-6-(5-phosphoribosylamino)uracil reductase RibD [Gammaproteobacteria bacterium]|nr:bifunctional diaminohydroxyphosphoribosylaminopyrimidine deaminase/5-amino-6-(5-phosphoribosylamino)uracil reductase RibD [Gammaproteobacteria bacterium]
MISTLDRQMMVRALQLARRGCYSTRPNPTVGCVLVRNGAVVGEGFTRPAGGNHAEIEALQSCKTTGAARGATAYVSLEPCSHHGKTGPCADALIEAGVAGVFVAMRDPNPAVTGQGITRLRQAGVDVVEGLLEVEARAINPGFYQRMESGRPRVRVKLACSLDGRTAMSDGSSQWITGAAARADVQRWRGRSGAILTGVETVIHDDPALTVRDESLNIPAQPLRVIVDSSLRTPPGSRILEQAGSTVIAYARESEQRAALEAAGAELLLLPGADGRVDLAALVKELATRQCNDILVECGARLAGSMLEQKLADEIVLYMAPVLLGSNARPLLQLPIDAMDNKVTLQMTDLRRIGDDLRLTLQPSY